MISATVQESHLQGHGAAEGHWQDWNAGEFCRFPIAALPINKWNKHNKHERIFHLSPIARY